MKRSGYLQRRTPLARGGRIPAVNRERKAKGFEAAYGDRGNPIRAMPCLCARSPLACCGGPIEAAHVKSRGAGGTKRDIVPLCRFHHQQQHRIGITTFERQHGVDLREEADRIALELDEVEGKEVQVGG